MTRIKVTPERLQLLGEQIRRCSGDLANAPSRLQTALSSLDWETRQSYDIEGQVAQACRMAQVLNIQAEQMAAYLRQRAQAFTQADQAGAVRLSRLQPLPGVYPSTPVPVAGGGLLIPVVLVGVAIPVIMAAVSLIPSLSQLPQWVQDRINPLLRVEEEASKPVTGYLPIESQSPVAQKKPRTGVIPRAWLEAEPEKKAEQPAPATVPATQPPAQTPAAKNPNYDVPLKAQGKLWGGYACSPTSASMVLDYYHGLDPANKTATPQELINSLDPGDGVSGKGMSLSNMTDELNDLGYHNIDVRVNATLGDLKDQLAQGPVIAIVGLGNIGHAIVVKGISADGTILVNDPLGGIERKYSPSGFEAIWVKGQHSLYAIRP
jgi:hypothetical protein